MEDYITIQPWQIKAYYESWQVEYLENNIVRITDSMNGKIRLFKLVEDNSNPEQLIYPTNVIVIQQPIPTAIKWHELTNWRHAKRLLVQYPQTWKKWKEKNLIPLNVLKRVEEDDTPVPNTFGKI